MTQAQKAAAWDALMALMIDSNLDAIVIEDSIRERRMFWEFSEWLTIEPAAGDGPERDLYRGPDPLAALAALTAEAQS